MANNFAAFFETLVAGADEYNKAKVGRTALLDAVYKDIKPEAARIGKTVDVYFPDVGPLQAINNGILTATTVNPNYIPLVFQTRAGAALQFHARVENLRCRLAGFAYTARFESVLSAIECDHYYLRSAYPECKNWASDLSMAWLAVSRAFIPQRASDVLHV